MNHRLAFRRSTRAARRRQARDLTTTAVAEPPFRSLLESAPDAIVIVDESGRIVFANAQAEHLLLYTKAELIGRPVELLMANCYRAGHGGYRERFLDSPTARVMGAGRELSVRRNDGVELPAEISLSPLVTDDRTLVSASIRDVTERRRAEETRRRLAAIIEHTDDAVTANAPRGHDHRVERRRRAPVRIHLRRGDRQPDKHADPGRARRRRGRDRAAGDRRRPRREVSRRSGCARTASASTSRSRSRRSASRAARSSPHRRSPGTSASASGSRGSWRISPTTTRSRGCSTVAASRPSSIASSRAPGGTASAARCS